jgi:hypothetical protein
VTGDDGDGDGDDGDDGDDDGDVGFRYGDFVLLDLVYFCFILFLFSLML